MDQQQSQTSTTPQPQAPRFSTTHLERYYHFDLKKEENRDIAAACSVNALFFFSHITVFARRHAQTGEWHMAVAFCSREDAFDRRIGRLVARRRYFADLSRVHYVGRIIKYDRVKDIVNKVLIDELRSRISSREKRWAV